VFVCQRKPFRNEAVKGPYMTRGKYILKAVDRLLQEEEEKQLVAVAAVGAAASSK
jgi:hypothetical protein